MLCSADQLYISSDARNGTCTVNDTQTLQPCYSMDQLSNDSSALVNKVSISLCFLPGNHTIDSENFSASNVTQLNLQPWKLNKAVTIKYLSEGKLVFKKVHHLNIRSMQFTSCGLMIKRECIKEGFSVFPVATRNIFSIDIINCQFKGSKMNYAITVNTTRCYVAAKVSIDNSMFLSNEGAVYLGYDGSLVVRNTIFKNNAGCLSTHNIDVHLSKCEFRNNTITKKFLQFTSSTVVINNTDFQANYVMPQSTRVLISSYLSSLVCHNSTFRNNTGIGIYSRFSSLHLQAVIFQNNVAQFESGSAVHALSSRITISKSQFEDNSCGISGGALYISGYADNLGHQNIVSIADTTFRNNVAESNGGAIYCYDDHDLNSDHITISIENSIAELNSATTGGFMHLQNGYIKLCRVNITDNNATIHGGAFYAVNSTLDTCTSARGDKVYIEVDRANVTVESQVIVRNNSALAGGAIYATDYTTIIMSGVALLDNTAEVSGGAMVLNNSRIDNVYRGILLFSGNIVTSAAGKGGALHVTNRDCVIRECFMQYVNIWPVVFTHNSASLGSAVYGGLMDRCFLHEDILRRFVLIPHVDQPQIASDPIRVCLVSAKGRSDCGIRELSLKRMRDEQFSVLVAVVDQVEQIMC